MIPTLMLAGLAIGLLPRLWYIVGLVLASAAWPILLAASSPAEPIDVMSAFGEFAIAAANTAIGVFVARKLLRLFLALRG